MKPIATVPLVRVSLICLATALTLVLADAASAVTLHTYRTGIDTGNDSGTGCSFSLGAVAPGALPGFELQVTVVVDNDLAPPAVVSAQVETCAGGVFGSPQPLPGFVLELDSGLLGSDSVIGSIPLALLGDGPAARLAHHALAASGSQDALFTVDGAPDGTPIVVRFATPASPAPLLNQLGIGLLLLLLIAVAWPRLRRGRIVSALAVFAIVAGAVVAYAAFGDPAATDDQSDSNPSDTRAEIFAAFTMVGGDALMVRLDIEDIPVPMENCSDSIDNDSDILIDCADPDCNGQTCSDLNPCTEGDACSDSACVGTAIDCNDNNECTQDICDAGQCVNTPPAEICGNTMDDNCDDLTDCEDPTCNGQACTDGNSCTGGDMCSGGFCQGTPIACNDDNACTIDVCDAGTGTCVYAPLNCDDKNACTTESCEADSGCTYTVVECDDSNLCTMDSCDSGSGCAFTPIECDDSNACTEDTCEADTGCVYMPADGPGCD